jgi:hypothetical protein
MLSRTSFFAWGVKTHACVAAARYRARHPTPVTGASGQPLQPLVVNTRHHVLLLLPEAVQSAQPGVTSQPHDAALCFDLTLHTDMEALLLAAPDPLAAWAYDGDVVWSTPRGLRALCGRALLVDPLTLTTAVAEGGLQLQAPVTGEDAPMVTGTPAAAGAAAAAGAGAGAAGSSIAGVAAGSLTSTQLDVAAAAARIRQLVGAGWQPLLLAPPPSPGAGVQEVQEEVADTGSAAGGGKAQGYVQLVDVLRSQEAEGDSQQQGLSVGAALGAGAGEQGRWAGLHSVHQLLQQPQLLRELLEPHGDDSGAGRGGEQLLQRRLVQVLRLEQGWSWRHLQLSPSGAAAAEAAAIATATQTGWWRGPLMRGCVLREDAAVQATG